MLTHPHGAHRGELPPGPARTGGAAPRLVGRAKAIFVRGDFWAGKTRLVNELARLARGEVRTGRGLRTGATTTGWQR